MLTRKDLFQRPVAGSCAEDRRLDMSTLSDIRSPAHTRLAARPPQAPTSADCQKIQELQLLQQLLPAGACLGVEFIVAFHVSARGPQRAGCMAGGAGAQRCEAA